MDPYSAIIASALTVWAKLIDYNTMLLSKATPEQAAQLVQAEVDLRMWFPNLINSLKPKGTP